MTALFGWEWVEVSLENYISLHIICDRLFLFFFHILHILPEFQPLARSTWALHHLRPLHEAAASSGSAKDEPQKSFDVSNERGFHWFRLVFCPLDCYSSTSGHAQTTHGYIFKSWAIKSAKSFSNCVWWDTLPVQSFQKKKSGALAPSLQEFSWNWGCHNAESHLGRGRASKMRAVFDSWVPHSQKHGTLSGYLFVFLSLRHFSWRIDVPKKCDLQVNSPCSSVAISRTYV